MTCVCLNGRLYYNGTVSQVCMPEAPIFKARENFMLLFLLDSHLWVHNENSTNTAGLKTSTLLISQSKETHLVLLPVSSFLKDFYGCTGSSYFVNGWMRIYSKNYIPTPGRTYCILFVISYLKYVTSDIEILENFSNSLILHLVPPT